MSKSADDFWIWICYTGIVEREELLQQREFLFIRQQQGKGDTIAFKRRHEKPKALYFKGFGLMPELFKSCFPHQNPDENSSGFLFFVRSLYRTFVNSIWLKYSELVAQMDVFAPEKTHSWHDSWQGKRRNKLISYVIKN